MNFRNTMVMMLVVISFLTLSASAFAFEVKGTSNVYLTNNNFWRISGIKDPYIQFDSSLSTSIGNLEASISPWVSYNLDSKEVNEVDYILDIGYPVGGLSLNAGAIYYDVTDVPETAEVYGSAGYETEIGKLISLSPGVKFYYDVREINKAYFEASLSLGTPLFSYVSLNSVFGYDFGQFEIPDENGTLVAESKPTTLQLGISADYEITKGVTLSPSFTYVLGLHDGIDNNSFAGFKFGFVF
jgi:hypothetical protein